jgi:hypothetical protein
LRTSPVEGILRVRDLRRAVDNVRTFFTLSGAKAQDDAFADVSGTLSKFDGLNAEVYLDALKDAAVKAAAPPAEKHLRALQDAEFDEKQFLAALEALQSDKKLKKSVIAKIAKDYGASPDKKASAAKLIDAIKLHFYTQIYDRDSRQLARKATPV